MFRAYGPPVSSQSWKEGPDAEQPVRNAGKRSRRPHATLVMVRQCPLLSLAILDLSFR